MEELSHLLDGRGIDFDPIDHRIPCFPHIINICVQHILKEYTKADFSDIANSWPVGKRNIKKNEYIDALRKDSLKHARSVVSAIRGSPLRQENFRNIIAVCNDQKLFRDDDNAVQLVGTIELLHDVDTRWDSTYMMINQLRKLHPVGLHPSKHLSQTDIALGC